MVLDAPQGLVPSSDKHSISVDWEDVSGATSYRAFYTPSGGTEVEHAVPRWDQVGTLPSARYGASVVSSGGGVHIIGGTDGTTTLAETLKLNSDFSVTTQQAMPAARRYAAAAMAQSVIYKNGYVFVFGGADSTGAATTTTYEYNPAGSGTWTSRQAVPVSTYGAGVVCPERMSYPYMVLAGGCYGNANPNLATYCSTVYRYDFSGTGAFTSATALPGGARAFMGATDLIGYSWMNGISVFVGGRNATTMFKRVDTCRLMSDTQTVAWNVWGDGTPRILPDLPVYIYDPIVTIVGSYTLVVMGGMSSATSTVASATPNTKVYTLNLWNRLSSSPGENWITHDQKSLSLVTNPYPDFPIGIYGTTAALTNSANIIVAGGRNNAGAALDSIYQYKSNIIPSVFSATNLPSNTSFDVKIRAKNDTEESADSTVSVQTLPLDSPTNVQTINATASSVDVSWVASPDADWYRIEIDSGSGFEPYNGNVYKNIGISVPYFSWNGTAPNYYDANPYQFARLGDFIYNFRSPVAMRYQISTNLTSQFACSYDGSLAVTCNGKIYFVAGTSLIEFDGINFVVKKTGLSTYYPRMGSVVSTGTKIYIMGGYTGTFWSENIFHNGYHIYDATTNTLTSGTLPYRWAMMGTCYNATTGLIHVFAGTTCSVVGTFVEALYHYTVNPATNTWTRIDDVPPIYSLLYPCLSPHAPAVVCRDNKIYLLSSERQYDTLGNEVIVYDVATSTWSFNGTQTHNMVKAPFIKPYCIAVVDSSDPLETFIARDSQAGAQSLYRFSWAIPSGTTNKTVRQLIDGTNHNLRVLAMDSHKVPSTNPETVTFATLSPPPAAPTNVKATTTLTSEPDYFVRDTQFRIGWTGSAGATSYNVYINSVLKESGITGTSYLVTGLTANTVYTYEVKAVNSGGESSGVGGAVTTAKAPPDIGTLAYSGSPGSLTISWGAISGITTYYVDFHSVGIWWPNPPTYQSGAALFNNYVSATSINVDANSMYETRAGEHFWWNVSTYSDAIGYIQQSMPSATKTAAFNCAAPTSIGLWPVGTGKPTIKNRSFGLTWWQDGYVHRYDIFLDGSPTAHMSFPTVFAENGAIESIPGYGSEAVITGLVPDHTYSVVIKAVNYLGVATAASAFVVKTLPDPPTPTYNYDTGMLEVMVPAGPSSVILYCETDPVGGFSGTDSRMDYTWPFTYYTVPTLFSFPVSDKTNVYDKMLLWKTTVKRRLLTNGNAWAGEAVGPTDFSDASFWPESDFSVTTQNMSLLGSVPNIQADQIDLTSFRVTWGAKAGATGYHVFLFGEKVTTSPITDLFYLFSGKDPGVTYAVAVKAVNEMGEGEYSQKTVATKTNVIPTEDFNATADPHVLHLTWTAFPGKKYRVYLNGSFYGETTSGTMDVAVPGAGMTYTVGITSEVTGADFSEESAMLQKDFVSAPMVPPLPGSISLSGSPNGSVTISWAAVEEQPVGYRVWYSTDPQNISNYDGTGLLRNGSAFPSGSTITVAEAGTPPSVILTGFPANIPYWFAISAVDSEGGESVKTTYSKNITATGLSGGSSLPLPKAVSINFNQTTKGIIVSWT